MVLGVGAGLPVAPGAGSVFAIPVARAYAWAMKCPRLGCASVLLLASISCGGGGGGGSGGGGGEPPSPGPPVAITSANAQAVASAVWLGHAVSTADEILPQQVRDVLDDYFLLLAYRPNTLPIDLACGTSGAVTVDGALADAAHPGMSAGDRATALYRSCLQSHESAFPDLADGTLVVEVTSSTSEARTLSVGLESLKVGVSPALLLSEVGQATITLSNDGSSASLATDLLTATGGGQALILEDYRQSLVPGDTGSLLSFRGTQSGGDIDGSVTFDTSTPFHRPASGYPDAGELVITGAAGSSVAVQAQPDAVHLLLVVNGGAPIEITWDALEE